MATNAGSVTVDVKMRSQFVKPGWKTSEFWLTIAAKLLAVLFALDEIPQTWLGLAGVAAAVLSTIGYNVSRGMTKSAALAALGEAIGAGSSPAPDPVPADQAMLPLLPPTAHDFKDKDTKMKVLNLAKAAGLVSVLLLLVACASPIGALPQASGMGQAVRAGDASSKQEESIPQTGLAASYMGGVKQANVETKAQRQVQSTAGGPTQMAFQLHGLAEAIASDPVLSMLGQQSEVILEEFKKTPTPELASSLATLRKEAAERVKELAAQQNSLPNLSKLIVVNILNGYQTGTDTKGLTDGEASAEREVGIALLGSLGALFSDSSSIDVVKKTQ